MATFTNLERLYRDAFKGRETLTPAELIELSYDLFYDVRVEGLSLSDDPDNDVLMFWSGCIDDENGKEVFLFSISREWTKLKAHRIYEWAVDICYDADKFRAFGESWYSCNALQSPPYWRETVSNTPIFKALSELPPQKYTAKFKRTNTLA